MSGGGTYDWFDLWIVFLVARNNVADEELLFSDIEVNILVNGLLQHLFLESLVRIGVLQV